MKAVLILSLLLGLAACSGGQRASQAPQTSAQPSGLRVMAPQFSDHKPHPDVGRVPLRYPVHGVDLSRYQTGIDWDLARGSGVNFAFVKATEGGDGFDPAFPGNWTHSAEVGVKRGAYHMFYHCRPAREQARWFITHVPRDPSALPPVLDMEWTPTSPTCRVRRPAAEIRAEARVFLDMVAAHYGQRPILYTAPDFYRDNQMWKLTGVDFWLRSVAKPVDQAYPGREWTFWQYSGTGSVPGIRGKVDLNVFGGSADDWAAWVAARRPR